MSEVRFRNGQERLKLGHWYLTLNLGTRLEFKPDYASGFWGYVNDSDKIQIVSMRAGIQSRTIDLTEYFCNWTDPTPVERELWDLEFDWDYIPQVLLDKRSEIRLNCKPSK